MKMAIFDLDGTILDSMGIWLNTAFNFLLDSGIDLSEEERRKFSNVKFSEGADLVAEAYPDLNMSREELLSRWTGVIKSHYREDIICKDGVLEYIEKIKREGIIVCIATLTARDYFTPCLERLGIIDLFDFTITAEEAGRDKRFPDIFNKCAEKFGLKPEACRVFEDSFLAAETARKAGFEVCGIYDENSAQFESKLRDASDSFIMSWRELL